MSKGIVWLLTVVAGSGAGVYLGIAVSNAVL